MDLEAPGGNHGDVDGYRRAIEGGLVTVGRAP